MNGTYYPNPTFPTATSNNFEDNTQTISKNMEIKDSYLEDILKFNIGKKVKVYINFPDSIEWKDTKIEGIIEQIGKDYIIISDTSTGKWYITPTIYLNYIEFEEKINIL